MDAVVLLVDGYYDVFLLEQVELVRPFTNAVETIFRTGDAQSAPLDT